MEKIDQRALRNLKAEAVRHGLTLAEVFQEAAHLWLSRGQEMSMLTETDRDNEFYESEEAELGRQHKGRYVLIAGGHLVGAFDSIEAAGKAIRSLSPRPTHAILTKMGQDERMPGEWLAGSLER